MIHCSGYAAQMTSPDGTAVNLRYDAGHRMTAFIDAAGRRTSYGYDADGWVVSAQAPGQPRTTLTVRDWNTTRITDVGGQITTVLHAPARNVQAVIFSLGSTLPFLKLHCDLRDRHSFLAG